MKKIVNIIFASLLLLATGCQQKEYDELGELPDASVIDVTVSCNQDTNFVTFTFNNTGMLPVWHFEDGEVSSSTVVERLYTNAGTYEIEVKAMDRNGISENSKTISFTLDNSYVDETMMTALCGALDGTKSWVWNKEADGHFGCHESGSATGNGWYSASANSLTENGMYDDTMTFSASGAYNYNPGAGGTIYVNESVTISPFVEYAPGDGSAYQAQTTETTGSWSFSYDGDTTYIKLSSQMLAGYMPYDSLYETPIFKVISIEENLLVLIADNGSISWRFEFTPANN